MNAKGKGRNQQVQKIVDLDSLAQINLNAAGLDIGAEEIYACVPQGRDSASVRCFQTFTADLQRLADWFHPVSGHDRRNGVYGRVLDTGL